MLKDLYEARMARLGAGITKNVLVPGLGMVAVCEMPGSKLGSTTWEGALVLSAYLPLYLSNNYGHVPQPKVLELGAGTGLCGVAAALVGCDALLTDKAGEVTDVMRRTVDLNRASWQAAGGRCVAAPWRSFRGATEKAVALRSLRGKAAVTTAPPRPVPLDRSTW